MSEDDHLATVRQAYRYVVAYERRVLDALTVVHEEVERLGFAFGHWEPMATAFPKRNRFKGNDWAWNHVPLSNAQFEWAHGGRSGNAAGNVWLLVDHVADTGFENACRRVEREPNPREPNPLVDLAASDSCDSLFRAHWIRFDAAVAEKLWNKSWQNLLEGHFERRIDELWPIEPGITPTTVVHDNVATGGVAISIGAIDGPQGFRACFLDPVLTVLSELTTRPQK